MTPNPQITKGSIVQSHQCGWQGIITNAAPNFWALVLNEEHPTPEQIAEYRKWGMNHITDEEATSQRWFHTSDFLEMGFTAAESDLVIIPIEKVRFDLFPCAFHGTIFNVDTVEGDVVLLIKTNRPQATTCQGYSNVLVIANATVTPYVGDRIYGTQDYVVIEADGLAYPYTKVDNALAQDWNLPAMAPILGYQSDTTPTKRVAGIRVPIDLDDNGFEAGKHYEPSYDFREERITAARLVIRRYFTRTKTVCYTTSSYGLKHLVEQKLGFHLSNGELVVAMIGEGYTYARDADGINCHFNVSSKSIKSLKRVTPSQLKSS